MPTGSLGTLPVPRLQLGRQTGSDWVARVVTGWVEHGGTPAEEVSVLVKFLIGLWGWTWMCHVAI